MAAWACLIVVCVVVVLIGWVFSGDDPFGRDDNDGKF